MIVVGVASVVAVRDCQACVLATCPQAVHTDSASTENDDDATHTSAVYHNGEDFVEKLVTAKCFSKLVEGELWKAFGAVIREPSSSS